MTKSTPPASRRCYASRSIPPNSMLAWPACFRPPGRDSVKALGTGWIHSVRGYGRARAVIASHNERAISSSETNIATKRGLLPHQHGLPDELGVALLERV